MKWHLCISAQKERRDAFGWMCRCCMYDKENTGGGCSEYGRKNNPILCSVLLVPSLAYFVVKF